LLLQIIKLAEVVINILLINLLVDKLLEAVLEQIWLQLASFFVISADGGFRVLHYYLKFITGDALLVLLYIA
jgi:hypothetical protein